MEETMETPGVRESRRRAALARDVAERWSGPLQSTFRFTEEHPFSAIALGVVAGMAVALIVRSR